jgi:aspartyl-tRNA(Asn)/glutamyl-tRNA(Gln) amidotransferase subunit A
VHAIWSGLTPAQQAVVDPDFRAEAELGARYAALDVHRLAMRRVDLGSHLRQFMTAST